MKKLLWILAMLCVQAATWAAEPSTASLEHLLSVTQAQTTNDAVIEQMRQSMQPMIAQAIDTSGMTPAQRARAQQVVTRMADKTNDILADELAWPKMKEFSLQLYRETFSQDEVDQLIAFYESPIGQAFIVKMPLIIQKSTALMQQRMGPMVQRLRAAAAEIVQEFKAEQGSAP